MRGEVRRKRLAIPLRTQPVDEFIERAGIMVFASHSLELVRRLCNKAVVMKAGHVVAMGPVEAMIASYVP